MSVKYMNVSTTTQKDVLDKRVTISSWPGDLTVLSNPMLLDLKLVATLQDTVARNLAHVR